MLCRYFIMIKLFYSIKSIYLYSLGNIFFSILSITTISILWDLPNAWLVFYGIATICLWQNLNNLQNFILDRITSPKRFVYAIELAGMAILFLSSGILCANASLWLSPRSIIQDILGSCVYFSAAILVILLFYYCHRLIFNQTSSLLYHHSHVKAKRLENIEKWQKKQSSLQENLLNTDLKNKKKYLLSQTKIEIFHIKLPSYLAQRLFYVIIWTIIPLWIFWMIPNRSFHPLAEIHFIYTIGTVITITASSLWCIWLLHCAKTNYEFYQQGIIVYHLFSTQICFWTQVKSVVVEQQEIFIKDEQNHTITIPILEVQQRQNFWKELRKCLPIELFFVNDEGIQTIYKIPDTSNFIQEYAQMLKIETDNSKDIEKVCKKK